MEEEQKKKGRKEESLNVVLTRTEIKQIAYAFLNSYLKWKEKSRKTKDKLIIEVRTNIAEEEYKNYTKFIKMLK